MLIETIGNSLDILHFSNLSRLKFVFDRFVCFAFFFNFMNLLSESVSPLLTKEKLELLKSHKILTTLDFVQYNNDKMANLIVQNVSEIIKIKDKILASNNSKPMRGDKMFDMMLKRTVVINSGIEM